MKREWKKDERAFYLPKEKPELVILPEFGFFSIRGKGNPNDALFAEYIGVLYSLSYAVKMSGKKGFAPPTYFEYSVYPLEGVWDLDEEGRKNYDGKLDKNALVFNLMIRQPDFVTPDFGNEIIERTKTTKPHRLLEQALFERIEESRCVQMMHHGSYDDEPGSFAEMEKFAGEQQVRRKSLTHREIYLSDARKVEPDKLKTVLRFQVE
jgi:hypothetical protein